MSFARFRSLPLLLAGVLCFFIGTAWLANARQPRPQNSTTTYPLQSGADYTIVPDKMIFTGDSVICDDVIPDPTVSSWCDDLPPGSILLGVDPNSPNPSKWDGAQATTSISIEGISKPTVAVVSVSWPDLNGKGNHSPHAGRVTTITWDGVPIWAKATRDLGNFGNYYAAQHYPVKATAVLTGGDSHTLTLQVPANTVWDISSIAINLYPMPEKLNGIAYGPYRDCQNPHWGPFPTEAEIREDMARQFHMSNSIRTYSTLGMVGEIPRIANEYDIPVTVGAWLGREKDTSGNPIQNKNREEIDALIALANDPTLPNIEAVIVGNEVLLRRDLSEAELIAYIEEVKSKVNVPVTTAEISGILSHHPDVIDTVDFLTLHMYPYWEAQPLVGAAEAVADEYHEWETTYGKRVVIGETGWPSAGPANGPAAPTLENQRHFLYEFLIEAEEHDIEYFYFDAFDELWKREGGVGSHWGYMNSARVGKHEVQSLLMPTEELADFLIPHVYPYQTYMPAIFNNQLPTEKKREFIVFDEYASPENRFAPSGWMGDADDVDFYECDRTDPYNGEVAIRVTYDPQGPKGWAGVYWQEPPNNWGTIKNGGLDLTDVRGISFAAKGEQGGEWISFGVGGIGCGDPRVPYPDSICPDQRFDPDPITLSTTWQVYTLRLTNTLDLSNVVGGFFWAASGDDNPNGATFYLDSIRYLYDDRLPLQPHSVYYGPRLAKGYDMGVNTSGGQTDWATDFGTHICMNYPSGQQWGAVFITVGPPTDPPRPGKDLSMYQTLSLELKGGTGGEKVWIGLKDNSDRDNGKEAKVQISSLPDSWQVYNIPLSYFNTADLTRLYVVTEFIFEPDTPAETVCFRNIRYMP